MILSIDCENITLIDSFAVAVVDADILTDGIRVNGTIFYNESEIISCELNYIVKDNFPFIFNEFKIEPVISQVAVKPFAILEAFAPKHYSSFHFPSANSG